MALDISLENRRLLNPAFSGLLIVRAVQGFCREAKSAFPYIYSYLILPFVLHPETRERLPHAVVTRLPSWIERNSEVTTLFPRRVGDLAPATREALFLTATTGLITLEGSTGLTPTTTDRLLLKFEKESSSAEVASCVHKAHFVGRWLASSGTTSTVLTVLGVQI